MTFVYFFKIFQQWLAFKKRSDTDSRKEKKKSNKCKSICPLCNEKRFDLNGHLKAIHGLSEEKAAAFKSQHNMYKKGKLLSPEKRLSKPRVYKKYYCPVAGCHKVLQFITFVSVKILFFEPIIYKKYHCLTVCRYKV